MKLIKLMRLFIICLIFMLPSKLNAQPQRFTASYIDSITQDEDERKLYFPSFVFAESVRNEIYVISRNMILIYTSDLFPLFTLDIRFDIEAPLGLTVDTEGNLYVAQAATKDYPRHRISVFNACLKWERDIYFQGFEGADSFVPHSLAINKQGNIYVSASYFPGILILDSKGKFLEMLSPEEEERKVKITSLTVDKSGRIYLVSEEEGHVYVYDDNRKFLFQFGVKGGSSAKLSRPMAVGVDNSNGRIYVVDYMRHTISVYDKDGKYLTEFAGLGWGEGWLQHPRYISVDNSGNILVADTFNHRIEVFQLREQSGVKNEGEEPVKH